MPTSSSSASEGLSGDLGGSFPGEETGPGRGRHEDHCLSGPPPVLFCHPGTPLSRPPICPWQRLAAPLPHSLLPDSYPGPHFIRFLGSFCASSDGWTLNPLLVCTLFRNLPTLQPRGPSALKYPLPRRLIIHPVGAIETAALLARHWN